jgi:cell division protein FtsL
MKRGNGAIRMSLAITLLYASLATVVWRQSRALEELRGLEAARSERAILQAERSDLLREIQHLESRPRILAAAGGRLQLKTPGSDEIVFLQVPVLADAAEPNEPRRRGLLTAVERH